MPAERYYYPALFESGQPVFLTDQEYHHLVHVMRSRKGDQVEVVNGLGQLAQATINDIEKKKAILSLSSVYTQPPSSMKMILAQGIPRQNRLDFIVEKCTELGMTDMWLFPAAKSEKKELTDNQLERLKALMISAMKQCGRLFLPNILLMPPLKRWNHQEGSAMFFGDTGPNTPHFLSVCRPTKQEAIFFIGPESGFTEEEVVILKGFNAQGVSLHPNILRTDTAAIAAMTLLSSMLHQH